MKRNIVIVVLVIFGATAATAGAAKLITGKDIRNGSITSKDLSRGAKSALKGQRGPQGSRGPAGPVGPAGPSGPSAVSRLTRVENTVTVPAEDVGSASVSCPAGQSLVSGSFAAIAADGEVFYGDDFGTRTSWSVGLDNFDALIEGDVTAIAWCARTGVAVAARKVSVKRQIARMERKMLRAHGA